MNHLDEIKEFIKENYNEYNLDSSHHDYDNNPRLDDCFDGGYYKGYSKALYDVGKILGMNLHLPRK